MPEIVDRDEISEKLAHTAGLVARPEGSHDSLDKMKRTLNSVV